MLNATVATNVAPASAASAAPSGLSLETALANGLFQKATLIAGQAGCSRLVTGALPLETADVAGFLHGGELILTTGAAFKDDATAWSTWIERLAEAKAAGLVVLAGRAVSMIPAPAIETAERLGFPLVAIAHAGPLLEVYRPIAQALERAARPAEAPELPEGGALHKRLMQIVLDGQGLEAVAKLVAKRLDRAVAIEDRQFNLLACAAGGTGSAERAFDELIANKGTPVALMKQWEEDGTLQTLRKQHRPAEAETGGVPRRIYPVTAQGEALGFFTVFEPQGLEPAAEGDIETAATAVAVELLKQKGAVDSEQKIKRDFFRDLLMAHTPAMAETLRRRATYLGYPLTSAYWVVQIEFDAKKNEDVSPEDLNRLASVVNALLSFRQAIVVTQPQGVTILYPVKDGQPSLDKIQHLAKAILQKAGASGLTHTVSVGVGQCSPELLAVPKAFKEAQHALKIGRHTNGPGGVTFFSELGIYRMLLQFASSQDPSEFYCDALQRLVEYNQQTDKELVKTIAAFLECNGNLTETSAKLYIHRNTLKYRLERIKDITSIDLDDAENRLMLHLGLKMNQVINYLA